MKSPTFQWDGRTHALLTWTSTMDCWSWSLPAGKDGSCPMEDISHNSICNSCYAQQNRYSFRTVRLAQQSRLSFLNADPIRCLTRISTFIRENRLPYFRVHDSGDFHKPWVIPYWTGVVRSNPLTRFWFPTRAWTFPAWIPFLEELAAEPNASVRPSARHFGDEPPVVPGLSHGTVSMRQSLPGILDCPKSVNHTSCATESCRACWSKEGYVNYRPHGHLLKRVQLTVSKSCLNPDATTTTRAGS
jgi:hypothetical protein